MFPGFCLTNGVLFLVNGVDYFEGEFIRVANESSVKRLKATVKKDLVQPEKKSHDDWVAKILEIRAGDVYHMYACVYWMYSPDDLLPGTHAGKKFITGCQHYYGQTEMIASNHSKLYTPRLVPLNASRISYLAVGIINAISVTEPATISQGYKENGNGLQNAFYYRQVLDVRTFKLSYVIALIYLLIFLTLLLPNQQAFRPCSDYKWVH